MKQQYECLYIIDKDVTEEKRNELIAKWCKMAGESCKCEKWGIKKFVTPINYKKEGFYVLMNFESEPDMPKKMAELMNITEGVVRYMFVAKNEKQVKVKKNKEKKGIKA